MNTAIPFPILTTQRLVLREMRPSDAADVLLFKGDPVVQKYDEPPLENVEESRAFIEETLVDCAAKKCQAWGVVLTETNQVIGLIGLWDWDHYHRRAEIGYGIATKYWGHGLAQEAARAAARYGFEQMNLNRIYARTLVANTRSVKMLERLGFVREGTQRQYSLEDDGAFYDSAMFGLLREDGGIG